ncbi:MAG: hypothetical protein WBS19_05445 [Candidatus Korobacteraceae bacterium]
MQPANLRSPFQEGFAALREEPLLFAAELTWRWCFALAAWLLMLVAAALFLDSLKVSELDQFLLSTMQPALEWSAVNHILHGALLRAVWIKFIVLAGLTLLWAFAAAVGRAASLRNLIAVFGGEDRDEHAGWQFRPMFQLHLARALWIWIAVGCFAVSILLGSAMGIQRHAARAAFFYVFGIALSLVFGVMLNWFFGLAPLFCIRNQASAGDAIWLTLDFCERQAGRLFGLSLGFLALRLVWAGSMFFLILAPMSLGKHLAVGWIVLLMFGLSLIYFAGADALYLARLGSYAALAEIDAQPTPETQPAPEPLPQQQFGAPVDSPTIEWEPGPNGLSPSG